MSRRGSCRRRPNARTAERGDEMLGRRLKQARRAAWLVAGTLILLAGACAPGGAIRDPGAPVWDGLAYVAM